MKDAKLLAERLAGDIMIVRCFIFVNIGRSEDCSMVADEGKWKLEVRRSCVDLGTGVIPEYLT